MSSAIGSVNVGESGVPADGHPESAADINLVLSPAVLDLLGRIADREWPDFSTVIERFGMRTGLPGTTRAAATRSNPMVTGSPCTSVLHRRRM